VVTGFATASDAPTSETHRARAPWTVARRLGRQPVTLGALAVLAALFGVGALARQLAPSGWNVIDLDPRWANHGPTLTNGHLLGTDNIGRDVLVRTLYGLHVSEQAALAAALLATLLGIATGALAGYAGGWLDATLMRVADLITAFPAIVVLLAAFVFLTPVTTGKTTIIFALYMWTSVARVVRAEFVALRDAEFIQAAEAAGASTSRIITRHILPNSAGSILAAATSLIGQIILLEATVEFFGFGVASQVRPTLGNLIADAVSSGIGANSTIGLGWWVWAAPALVIVVILIATNLIGDGLDDALRPRSGAS
jgi:peptide/nickel transport system permease protein